MTRFTSLACTVKDLWKINSLLFTINTCKHWTGSRACLSAAYPQDPYYFFILSLWYLKWTFYKRFSHRACLGISCFFHSRHMLNLSKHLDFTIWTVLGVPYKSTHSLYMVPWIWFYGYCLVNFRFCCTNLTWTNRVPQLASGICSAHTVIL